MITLLPMVKGTTFDLRQGIITKIREIRECSLSEGKNLATNTPSVVIENITMEEALKHQESFRNIGAETEIVE